MTIVESVFVCATLNSELSCINGKPLRLKVLFCIHINGSVMCCNQARKTDWYGNTAFCCPPPSHLGMSKNVCSKISAETRESQ